MKLVIAFVLAFGICQAGTFNIKPVSFMNKIKPLSFPKYRATAIPRAPFRAPRETGNEYVDRILESLRAYMLENGLDSVVLPDQSFEFTGGDAFVEIQADGSIHITSPMNFGDLDGGYRLALAFMDIELLDAVANIRVAGLNVAMDAVVTIGEPTQAVINSLEIINQGFITVDIDGLGSLEIVVEIVADIVLNLFSNLLYDVIAQDFQDALQAILEGITEGPLPFLA
ncbi:unnamed protein product [Cyprideis torosa]|uniref:Uncharacterized protein n=1 Tax=Cyprideis torosa TaxID=163714 RepID=A0A7R8W4Z2_9CRUS|nr:unnamed protein product [Cyprideis torosa]CAG0883668.1 unnamed protein product [Cyprideis torosa]